MFALVAALSRINLNLPGEQLSVDGRRRSKITNVEGEGCRTCNIAGRTNIAEHLLLADAQAQRRPTGVADAAQAGIASASRALRTRCPDKQGWTITGSCWNGINPGDRRGIGVCHVGRVRYLPPAAFVQKVVSANSQVLATPAPRVNTGDQRIPRR